MIRLPSILRLPSRLQRRARRSRLATLIALLIASSCLLIPFYIVYKPPNLLIRYFQHRWPDVLWHIQTTEKIVALTIDDGPSQHTSDILQVLGDNDAAATFFVIGSQIEGREVLLSEIVRKGSELGNHAMHDEPARSLTDSALVEQLGIVQKHIDEAYGNLGSHPESHSKYFRPGSGFFTDRMRNVVAKMDYRLVLGSVYPHDPQISSWRVNARHILSMVRPGAIIICHDRRSWTAPMLKKVLPELKQKGYRVVTISGLLEAQKGSCGEDSCTA